ncbi:MAG TPA: Eco57I restriction-modification methylase domain-containing protein [Bryobacteraceae bacterium]|jgi:hypothetical protein|nr:Eco57I restriction-modification methylase domain-containing protein [Bryobacteraceae bacterium]
MERSQAPGIPGIQLQLLTPALFPKLAAEPKGVVYTKPWVVDLLLNLAGYTSGKNLVDAVAIEPAAGNGAFFGPMVERLLGSCQRLGRPLSDCADSLVAFELDEHSAGRARALAIETLLHRGAAPDLAESIVAKWVHAGDYLLEAVNRNADFVIGNPPYVRLESIPEEASAMYRKAYHTMRGRADLYVAFFEAALTQLNDDGVCAFICADRWMRNQYGGDLRRLITSAFAVETMIEMHDAGAFHDEVDAYPAITVIRRRKQTSTVVASAGPETEQADPDTVCSFLRAVNPTRTIAPVKGLKAARVSSWFCGSNPWPCHSPEQLALLRRLEEDFLPLEKHARVGIGVATGNDGVFVTRDPQLVEPSRVLKLALARDICSGRMEWSGHYLIDPWDGHGLVNLAAYPRLRGYFEKHMEALKRRHTAERNLRGWYKTIDRVNHALTLRPKLYVADIKNTLNPVLDRGETYPHHNLYFVEADDWDLEVLGGLLLSSVGQFFVASYGVRMRGGYLRFQAQYLRRIRVPEPQSLSDNQRALLKEAFRTRDRELATSLALEVYRIGKAELERALGS